MVSLTKTTKHLSLEEHSSANIVMRTL